jgi:hypothetical protein
LGAVFRVVRCLKGRLRELPIAPHARFDDAFLEIFEKLGAFFGEGIDLFEQFALCPFDGGVLLVFLLTMQGRIRQLGCLLFGEPFQLILDVTVIKVSEWVLFRIGRVRCGCPGGFGIIAAFPPVKRFSSAVICACNAAVPAPPSSARSRLLRSDFSRFRRSI